jgi:hypothetical protein
VCLDPRSGAIITIADPNQPLLLPPNWQEGFVNTDLKKFNAPADAVMARWPYYARSAFETDVGLLQVQNACRDLLASIEAVHPPAAVADMFWATFVDDVGIGDFAVEDLHDASHHVTLPDTD